MRASLRIKTTVLPGHRIEFSSPELNDGEAVDVLITQPTSKRDNASMGRQQLLSLPVAERRKILERQAELLQKEYNPDLERNACHGGDTLEATV